MSRIAEAEAQVRDLFGRLGPISTRAMFGGVGVYCDGLMFALIDRERDLYLKAEGVMARAMAADGSHPFEYMRDGAPRRLGYWSLPASAWDDPDEACLWGARALDLARAAAQG